MRHAPASSRVKALLDGGAAVDARDGHGRTALHQATIGGYGDILELLLQRGADPNAADRRGYTPLALVEDRAEIARILLTHGANPNADLGGITLLLAAAQFRPPEVLALLIDAGGDLSANGADGRGILEQAESNGPRARKFLKERLGVAPSEFDRLQERMKELPKLAKVPALQAAAERLGRIFNRKPAPWKRRKGVVYFHDVSLAKHLSRYYGEAEAKSDAAMDQASRLLTKLQDELLGEGFVFAFTHAMPEEGRLPLILLPTADKYAALLACGTNGINHGHDTAAVIAWLKAMEADNSFHLGGCGHNFLQGRFAGPVRDAEALATRMIEFCPDIADQAHASLRRQTRNDQAKAIARDMTKTGWFAFWWD